MILSLVNPITAGFLILTEALVYFCIACGLFVNDIFWIFKFLAMKLFPSIIENPNSLLFLHLPNPGDSYVIPIVAPLAGLLITYIGVVLYDFIVEQQDKKFLKSTFGAYISPDLIDEMYQKKQEPKLGLSLIHI